MKNLAKSATKNERPNGLSAEDKPNEDCNWPIVATAAEICFLPFRKCWKLAAIKGNSQRNAISAADINVFEVSHLGEGEVKVDFHYDLAVVMAGKIGQWNVQPLEKVVISGSNWFW